MTHKALLGFTLAYLWARVWRIVIAVGVLLLAMSTMQPLFAFTQRATVLDFMVEALGNQVVTYVALPFFLMAVEYDLYAMGVNHFRVYLLTRTQRFADVVKIFVAIILAVALLITGLIVLLSFGVGLVGGYPLALHLTQGLAIREGVAALPNRIILIFVFALFFGVVTLLAGIIWHSVLASVGADLFLWGGIVAVFKDGPSILAMYPVYPGSGLYWGNYLQAARPELIGLSNVFWLLLAIVALWWTVKVGRRQY